MRCFFTFLATSICTTTIAGSGNFTPPDRANTLYSESANLSNGAGEFAFAGVTADGDTRRGLIFFDVSTLPAGEMIEAVTVEIDMNRTTTGPHSVSLHRVTRNWGSATSAAPGQEGRGGVAVTGDATWLNTFFGTETWVNPGGDFVAAPSATITVDGNGTYSWTDGGLIDDVATWAADPNTNFGWIIIGDETISPSTKRFDIASALLAIGFTPVELMHFKVE